MRENLNMRKTVNIFDQLNLLQIHEVAYIQIIGDN